MRDEPNGGDPTPTIQAVPASSAAVGHDASGMSSVDGGGICPVPVPVRRGARPWSPVRHPIRRWLPAPGMTTFVGDFRIASVKVAGVDHDGFYVISRDV